MQKKIASMLILTGALAAVVALSCGNDSAQESSSGPQCLKMTLRKVGPGDESGTAIYAKSGGQGKVVARLSSYPRVTVLKTEGDWKQIRVQETGQEGWANAKSVGTCDPNLRRFFGLGRKNADAGKQGASGGTVPDILSATKEQLLKRQGPPRRLTDIADAAGPAPAADAAAAEPAEAPPAEAPPTEAPPAETPPAAPTEG